MGREGLPGVLMRLKQIAKRTFSGVSYAKWAAQQERQVAFAASRYRTKAEALSWQPKISILMPTFNSRIGWLREAIESVLAQYYPGWELCIADDASSDVSVRALLDEYQARDARIKTAYRATNGHISAATNTALELATGEFISLMDHDDLIPPHALVELVMRLNEDPSLDMVYSDEDKIDTRGQRFDPFFKPEWSPDYLECCMYTAHLALYRKALVDRIGGFRSEYDGAQDYDFVLRFTEHTNRVGHVPLVLYHWRAMPGSTAASMEYKSYVVEAGYRALRGRLARTGRSGVVRSSRFAACFEMCTDLPRRPSVSIVIPTAGGDRIVRGTRVNLVSRCVEKIRAASTYPNYEIVIVDNGDLRPSVRDILLQAQCRLVTFSEREFNISKKLNLGAAVAQGEYLLLLNDDTEVISPKWMESLLEQALKPGVGVVGAKLLYENDTIQHAGVAHHRGLPDHVRKHFPCDDAGYYFSTASVKNYLAVTGACMLTSGANFRRVGGFDEAFRVNYSDIDYCLRLGQIGLRTIYTPHAELYHYESASRDAGVPQEEIHLFLTRWRSVTMRDPYYNGNFLQTSPPDFSLHLPAFGEAAQ